MNKNKAAKGAPREWILMGCRGAAILVLEGESIRHREEVRVREVLPPESPGIESAEGEAKKRFTHWFVKNYPGPNTVIYDPKWHAPRLFAAVMNAMTYAEIKERDANPCSEVEHANKHVDSMLDACSEPLDASSNNTRSSGHFVEVKASINDDQDYSIWFHNKFGEQITSRYFECADFIREQTLRSDVVMGLRSALQAIERIENIDWPDRIFVAKDMASKALAAFDQAKGGE